MPCRLCSVTGHNIKNCPQGGTYKKASQYISQKRRKEIDALMPAIGDPEYSKKIKKMLPKRNRIEYKYHCLQAYLIHVVYSDDSDSDSGSDNN